MLGSRVKIINKDVIALLLTLFLSVVLLLSNASPQIFHLKSQILKIVNFLNYPTVWYDNILVTKEQNKLLKDRLMQFTLLNSELESYRYENVRLKEMLDFMQDKTWKFLTANVTGHDFGVPTQTILIDVGRKNNVKNNMTIMDENGLLGKTVKVYDNTSLVQLITDKNFRVSIRVGKERALGLFIPTHGKYGLLEGVRKSLPLNEGEIVYTSGISEIYPPNIPVAKVININLDDVNPFQHIVVELLVRLEQLDYVFLLL